MKSRQLIISHRAESDLRDIFEFVAEDSPQAAHELIHAIVGYMRVIAESGLPGRSRAELGDGVRSLVCRQRVIFFRIDETSVRVMRVLHGRRDIGTSDLPTDL